MASVMSRTAPPSGLFVGESLPETLGYRLKRRFLGPALTNDQLAHERLTKKLALGVLSSDCISSSAYGTEEILLILLPLFGIASYALLLPMTLVVLAVLIVVTLSYRKVVMVYTKAGGSYVVARENFGPAIAQIAAVALMLDYIVTVAVQAAAGTVALTSAFPSLGSLQLYITVAVVVGLFYGNLRGIREAGRAFAFPTYFFVVSMVVMLVAGFVREAAGTLKVFGYPAATGSNPPFKLGHGHEILAFGAVYILLKAFANGGSSLTGLEAISNGVGVFQRPEGVNARRTLVVMSVILGTLVAGVSWMAHLTHAVPYQSGSPSVISQVAKAAFGTSAIAHVAFYLLQASTMLILYTGANTPFAGFPFLTSFVAEDSFLPRWLSKRGHRLAFSNGIVVLAVCAIALIVGTDAHVDKLIAFYAIGVFTGFTMAGFGMAKYYRRHRTGKWRSNVAVNLVSGTVSAVVVVIFAVTKFTEGAWLVLLIFPVMVAGLLKLRRQYAREAEALASAPQLAAEPHFGRHVVLVLIDSVDLAVLRAIRYARSLRPYDVRAVHFVVDAEQARRVELAWADQPGLDLGLDVIECPDRRISRAALELAARVTADGSTQVTLLLPRRTYSPLLGRLLHDRTADEIAEVVSRLPHAAATIVPFDVAHPIVEHPHSANVAHHDRSPGETVDAIRTDTAPVVPAHPAGPATTKGDLNCDPTPEGVTPLGDVTWRQRATVQGRVRTVSVTPVSGVPALRAELCDASGGIVVMFYGRRKIQGIEPGATLRVEGMVGSDGNRLAILNPLYELVLPPGDES
jgi:amino acid transporter